MNTVLGQVAGTLMSVDLDDVEVGDIVFLGGHTVRRVTVKPHGLIRENGNAYRRWWGRPLQETEGEGSRFQADAGQPHLVLRGPPGP